jgi:lysine biosynthesis protein LysW
MVNCPACDSEIDIEEVELDEGDTLTCEDCGANLAVASVNPVELESLDEEEEDEDDLDYDDEEEDENWK